MEEGEQRRFGQSSSGLAWWELVRATIQSTALFAGISVVFGRIYFIMYLENLGIPSTAAKLSVLEYAVISPDVTIVSVALAVAIPIAVANVLSFSRGSLGVEGHGNIGTVEGLVPEKVYAVLGLVAVVGSFVLKFVSLHLNFNVGVGWEGLLLAIGALSVILAYSTAFAVGTSESWRILKSVVRYIQSGPLFTFFLLCILVFGSLLWVTANFARSDSLKTLISSPIGVLNMETQHIPSEVIDRSLTSGETSVPVRVLLITEDLVFVAEAADTEYILDSFRDSFGLKVRVALGDLSVSLRTPQVFAIPREHIDSIRILSS